jgi:hypothetical protein
MELQGQIQLSSKRCELMRKTLEKYKCKNVVEIGTWKGMGSTLCIIKSLSPNSNFITLESNKSFYDAAKSNLESYQDKLNMIYGSIVSIDEITDFASDLNLDEEKRSWLYEDLQNIKLCPNVLNDIFDNIDFLLLDGGEFSTYKEWEKLKKRTNIVALDDVTEIKTNKIYNELSKDINYELVGYVEEGNGFCIFIKK